MICDVIISKANNKFIARAKDWPEITAKENSRDKAINSITSRLINYLNHEMELVKIEVPLDSKTGNPWVDKFGWFKDDPTFDDLEDEIAYYRKELDSEMGYSTQ